MTNIHTRPDFAVSVVIPTLDASRTIAAQLGALSEQSTAPAFEVVIADNGSSDDTLTVAATFMDRLNLRLVDASGTRGASYARNVGALNATAPVLAFLDADDVAAPGWLAAMHDVATSHPEAVLFGHLDYRELNDERLIRAYRYSVTDPRPRQGESSTIREIDPFIQTLPGGNFAVSAETWADLGGMRIDFPYGAEDAEFGFRASEQGIRTLAVPGAVVHCRLRGNARAIFAQQRSWARARARLAASEPRTGFGPPSVKSSLAVLIKSIFIGVPASVARLDIGPLANDLGISAGRLEGALFARASRRASGCPVARRRLMRILG